MRKPIILTMKTMAATVALVFMSMNPLFASAKADTEINTQKHVVIVRASMNDMVFVAAGQFLRSFHNKMLQQLKNRNALASEFNETLQAIDIDSNEITMDYSRSVDTFNNDFGE